MTGAARVGLASAAALGALAARRWARGRAYSFRHRSVLITGGSRGLGLEMARLLAREGASLTLLARDEQALERAREDLLARGAEVLTIPCDVRDRDAVERALLASVDPMVNLATFANRLLPRPTGSEGDQPRLGRDAGSRVAFSHFAHDYAALRRAMLCPPPWSP